MPPCHLGTRLVHVRIEIDPDDSPDNHRAATEGCQNVKTVSVDGMLLSCLLTVANLLLFDLEGKDLDLDVVRG